MNPTLKWLLIILVAVIVLGGGYLAYAKYGKGGVTPTTSPSPVAVTSSASVSPSATSSIPADWKTYTNTTYKYNVKYPTDWVASEPGSKRTAFAKTPINGEGDQLGLVEIRISSLSFVDTEKQAFIELGGGSSQATVKDTIVAGVTAKEYTGVPSSDLFGGGTHRERIIVENNNVVYVLEVIDNGDQSLVTRFHQMLSTFQFTP